LPASFEEALLSRPVEEILEFDRLREILSRFTTCALGRCAIAQLAFTTDRAALEAAFALTREAIASLRAAPQ
jgi:dsDNA-specific endonuclease/ATPase MutS2